MFFKPLLRANFLEHRKYYSLYNIISEDICVSMAPGWQLQVTNQSEIKLNPPKIKK